MSNNNTSTPAPSTSLPASSPTQSPSQQPSLTPPSSSVAPPTTAPPSSTPVNLPSSNTPAPPSSAPPTSNPPPPPPPSSSSAPPPPPPASSASSRSTTTAPSAPPSTQTSTSVTTISPTEAGATPLVSTVVVTRTSNSNPTGNGAQSGSPSPSDTSAPGLQNPKGDNADGGLTTGGKTAIAVVVPVVVVALLVIGGILLWRRRKTKKNAEEARRKEVEEYGFNPNNDPTLPAVGMQSEMAEDQSGYRGWGNTATSSNRKASTTLTSGMAYSDSNSNPGGYHSPNSPTQVNSDSHSGDPLVHGRRETMDSDGIGALGAGPNANHNQGGVHRGPSNASSSYSAAERSDNSGEYPVPPNNQQDYYGDNNQGYYHASPYDPNEYVASQQPIIRDVSARRNTRIENPSVFPQQGNSGIAQNF